MLLCRNDERQEVKHLIAFLGYNQSRIQHPVYRQFVQAPVARRNATLLFQSRPLEERELIHEVNELRRREGMPCEITFHLCATLSDPAMGQQLVQTVTMIHRLYDCPSYVYCLLPDLDQCTEEQRKATWKCLVAINNGITDYPHLRLISHCFLYHDATQVSLARFLYQTTRHPEAMDLLERYGYMNKVNRGRRTGDQSYVPEFPGIFSTFNAAGIIYPDDEIRYYIHQSYLNALLSLSRPKHNTIAMQTCNEHVQQLLSALPLADGQITLTDQELISLPQSSKHQPWTSVEQYWTQCVDKAVKDLEDRPREEWLNQLQNRLEVHYQTRFREMGVDYFYKNQRQLTPDYCNLLLSQLRQSLRHVMQSNPYPPETCLDIVRSLVNNLQQLAVRMDLKSGEYDHQATALKAQFTELCNQWDAMGFFDRMRGKDKLLFEDFRQQILRYYIIRTELQGTTFATKLLNELIPQVAGLADGQEALGQLCQEALDSTQHYLSDNQPTEFIDSTFPAQPALDAAQAIRVDRATLLSDYLQLLSILYEQPKGPDNSTPLLDSEMLLQSLRDALSPRIDQYIHQRIQDGTMSPVLDVCITDRLAAIYAERGGIQAFVERLKEETALTLRLKGEGGHNEQYLLIAPDCKELKSNIQSCEASSVQMLHILTAISLTDLDGFTGQRMFVEPSMF